MCWLDFDAEGGEQTQINITAFEMSAHRRMSSWVRVYLKKIIKNSDLREFEAEQQHELL